MCTCRRIICVVVLVNPCVTEADDLSLSRPSALVILDANPSLVFVANQGSGNVSLLSRSDGRVIEEFPVGKGLSHLVKWPDTEFLLAVDSAGKELHVLRHQKMQVSVVQTLPLSAAPSRIAVSDDGAHACLTFQWAAHTQLIRLQVTSDNVPDIKLSPPVEIGFPQQEVVALPRGKFLLADRFRGQLAIVDSENEQVTHRSKVQGHNIRGLLVKPGGKSVLVAYQILSRVARTTLEDVHWGMVMQNVVQRIPVADLISGKGDVSQVGQLYRVGDTGNGFADPAAMVVVGEQLGVLSAGTNQLLVMSWDGKEKTYFGTGNRPVAVQQTASKDIVIANALSDSVTIIEQAEDGGFQHRVTGKSASPLSDLVSGEQAFFDGRLSHDGWMSCHSCHTEGHSPDLLADTLGDGGFGAPKRIPSLLGTADTAPWGWTGNKSRLDDQIRQTLTSTMHTKSVSDETISHLEIYLKSLAPPAPMVERNIDTAKGEQLFRSLKCVRCHGPSAWTTAKIYDVGLQDEQGQSEFNPPSLRGVGLRRRYFHDGRAKSLESVLKDHKHNLRTELDEGSLTALTMFLMTL